MKLVTAAQMRTLDQAAIAGGISSLDLMERAGEGIARAVQRLVGAPGPIGVVLGRGNNAGDGIVAARHLRAAGYVCQLLLTHPPEDFSPDAKTHWNRIAPGPADWRLVTPATIEAALHPCTGLIDALLGTGLAKAVRAPLDQIILAINAFAGHVISADIPSGLSADTGQPLGIAVEASTTVTFGLPKLGLLLDTQGHVGHIEVVDIGLPQGLTDALDTSVELSNVSYFRSDWPKRPAESHKGTFGHLLVIAGSTGKIGAGYLASLAALRMGAGLVTYALPQAAYDKFPTDALEVMVAPLPDGATGQWTTQANAQLDTLLAGKTALAIGPGLGQSKATGESICRLLQHSALPIVLDADALNAVAGHLDVLNRQAPTILTPHPGEMARLIGQSASAVQVNRLSIAKAFAQQHGVWLVLKGHRTIIAGPDGTCLINPTGNPGMATAGSGDVLTGMLSGLITQGMPLASAIAAAVYLHGLAGDLAAAQRGEAAMIASDIIAAVPEAIRIVQLA